MFLTMLTNKEGYNRKEETKSFTHHINYLLQT